MSTAYATRLANALRFELFYERWEARRSGPSPEELGSADARAEMKKGKAPA